MVAERYGRYILKQKLGQGGMGAVYAAHDPHLDRLVALKLLPHALLHDPTFRDRFTKEARLIARMRHPAIVPVHDFGEDHGQPFMIMDLMTGGTLVEKLAEGPLSLKETGRILDRICGALDRAHQRNVIHRDIKPANILFDEDGEAHLADFGIARLAEGTQTMTIIGTPRYMAPEQAHGKALDARTDLYQLGVVLYEMLTGEAPFQANTPAALLHRHAYESPPSPLKLNSLLPVDLDEVVRRALAKEQDARFPTTVALAMAFRAACHSTVIAAQMTAVKPTGIETEMLDVLPPAAKLTAAGDEGLETVVDSLQTEVPDIVRAVSHTPPPVSPDDKQETVWVDQAEKETPSVLVREAPSLTVKPLPVIDAAANPLPWRRLPLWGWGMAGGGLIGLVVLLLALGSVLNPEQVIITGTATRVTGLVDGETETATATATQTSTPSPTATLTETPSPTAAQTSTLSPTATSTNTPPPPTSTHTITPAPSSTPVLSGTTNTSNAASPVIDRLEYRHQPYGDGSSSQIAVHFHDSDGDVSIVIMWGYAQFTASQPYAESMRDNSGGILETGDFFQGIWRIFVYPLECSGNPIYIQLGDSNGNRSGIMSVCD